MFPLVEFLRSVWKKNCALFVNYQDKLKKSRKVCRGKSQLNIKKIKEEMRWTLVKLDYSIFGLKWIILKIKWVFNWTKSW